MTTATDPISSPPRGALPYADRTTPPRQVGGPTATSDSTARRREAILAYLVLAIGAIIFLVPFYFVVNGSLKGEVEVLAGDFVTPAIPPTWSGRVLLVQPSDVPAEILAAFQARANELHSTVSRIERETAAPASEASAYAALVEMNEPKRSVELRIREGKVVESIWVRTPALSNYPRALAEDKMNFRPALANTVVITTFTVLGQIVSCSLVGFGFARFRFRGRGVLFMLMLSTMMLPAQVTMIPVFVLFRWMGMIDSFWPLIIPAWLASPFYVFMFRQFFSQIPEELIEAARIDGCSNWRIYWQMMLPLSGPVIAIVAIQTFLFSWNDFLGPLIYLNSPEKRTLALALNSFRGQYGLSDAHLMMAATVVCMIPCIILFFAAQRYFVESVASTGLKS